MSDKEVYQQMLVAVEDAEKEAVTCHSEQRFTGERPKPGEYTGEEEKIHYMNFQNLLLRLTRMRQLLEWEKEKAEERERKKKEEEEKVLIPLCHHMRENGKPCRAAAVRKQKYCSYHLKHRGRRLKMAAAQARGEHWRVELPPLEDLYAVQVGIQRVLEAVAGGQLERSQAWAMLYGLQQAAANLRLPQQVWETSDRFGDGEQVEWDTFAEEHGLAEDFDVDTPPDEAFPLLAASTVAVEARKAPQAETDGLHQRAKEA